MLKKVCRFASTYRAVVYDQFGGPEVLKIKNREIEKLASNSVRIKVEYSALNRADLVQRETPFFEGSGIRYKI